MPVEENPSDQIPDAVIEEVAAMTAALARPRGASNLSRDQHVYQALTQSCADLGRWVLHPRLQRPNQPSFEYDLALEVEGKVVLYLEVKGLVPPATLRPAARRALRKQAAAAAEAGCAFATIFFWAGSGEGRRQSHQRWASNLGLSWCELAHRDADGAEHYPLHWFEEEEGSARRLLSEIFGRLKEHSVAHRLTRKQLLEVGPSRLRQLAASAALLGRWKAESGSAFRLRLDDIGRGAGIRSGSSYTAGFSATMQALGIIQVVRGSGVEITDPNALLAEVYGEDQVPEVQWGTWGKWGETTPSFKAGTSVASSPMEATQFAHSERLLRVARAIALLSESLELEVAGEVSEPLRRSVKDVMGVTAQMVMRLSSVIRGEPRGQRELGPSRWGPKMDKSLADFLDGRE